jgi:Ketopantoate reductase
MKTLIIGTGVIGTIYGWALKEAGIPVVHYIRPGKKEQYKKGVQIDILDERKGHLKKNKTIYYPECIDSLSPENDFELVILPTNSYQTETALRTIMPLTPKAFYLIMAANWESTGFIDRLIPRDRYLMGYADGGGTIQNGAYWTNLGAEIHLGAVDASQNPNLEKVAALLRRADMKPDIPQNIVHWLWVHNASSVSFWAAFLKYRNVKDFLKDKNLLKKAYIAMKECLDLCEKRGVNIEEFPDVQSCLMPVWLFIPVFRHLWRHNESMQRFTAHAANSMKECKANYEAMMKTAQELHLEMPKMKELGQYLCK